MWHAIVDGWVWLSCWLKDHEALALWLEGIALVLIFIWDRVDSRNEHKETIRQLALAEMQAEATKRSADALINIERAWLVTHDLVHPRELPGHRLHPLQTVQLAAHIRNFGRTPGWLSEWIYRSLVVTENTEIRPLLDYSSPNSHPGGMPFAPEQVEDFFLELNSRPSELDEIQSGARHLYVYGVVRYSDIFHRDSLHETYFCFHYYRRRDERGNFHAGWEMSPPEANRFT